MGQPSSSADPSLDVMAQAGECSEAQCFLEDAETCDILSADPTLQSCCARDLEEQATVSRLKAQLSIHDRSKERLRAAGRVIGAAPPPPPLPRPVSQQQQQVDGSDLESEDDAVAEHLRAQRLLELQREAERRTQLQQAGHGSLSDVAEARLLREVEESAAAVPLVAHLAFEGNPLDAELDQHLAQLAHRHLGTRFVRTPITLRTTLHLRLRTPAGPGLLCFRDGCLVGAAGLDAFGAPECIREEAVDKWLRRLKVLQLQQQLPSSSSGGGTAAGATARRRGGGFVDGSGSGSEEGGAADEGDDWQQPCDVCGRRYPHQHIRSMYAGGGSRRSGSDSEG